jgi:patatin-like phospholipase/acyl hydrolase
MPNFYLNGMSDQDFIGLMTSLHDRDTLGAGYALRNFAPNESPSNLILLAQWAARELFGVPDVQEVMDDLREENKSLMVQNRELETDLNFVQEELDKATQEVHALKARLFDMGFSAKD